MILTASETLIFSKQELIEATLLVPPIPEISQAIMVKEADLALGVVVQHRVTGNWSPHGFYIVKLIETQQQHIAYDRELLVAYSVVKQMLGRRPFTLSTDQKPTIFSFNQHPAKVSPRLF